MKVLILRFSSIGDIVLTTPVVRCLNMQMPSSEIHYATKEAFYPLLQHNPHIHSIHVLTKTGLSELIQRLKMEKFDLIIDLHHNIRTTLIKLQLGVKSYSFNKLNLEKWLFVNLKVNYLPVVHIVDRYLGTLSKLGIKNDNKGLDYYIPEIDEVSPDELPGKYIAVVIGAKFATKRFPNHKLVALCDQVKMPVVILGGKEDISNSEWIVEHCAIKPINKCGQYNLNQSASVIRQAEFVITNDTGLMHIAAAFQKKIISVWGNTTPMFGMYPYMPAQQQDHHLIIENKNLSCRPCSKIGYATCPKGHFKCMEDIDINELIKGLQRLD